MTMNIDQVENNTQRAEAVDEDVDEMYLTSQEEESEDSITNEMNTSIEVDSITDEINTFNSGSISEIGFDMELEVGNDSYCDNETQIPNAEEEGRAENNTAENNQSPPRCEFELDLECETTPAGFEDGDFMDIDEESFLEQSTNSNNAISSPNPGPNDDWVNEARAQERTDSENERTAAIEAGMQLAQMMHDKYANEAKNESNTNEEDGEEEKTTVGDEDINMGDGDTSSISSSEVEFTWSPKQSANNENETQNEERLNIGDNEEVQCQDTNDGRDNSQVWVSRRLKPLRMNLLPSFEAAASNGNNQPETEATDNSQQNSLRNELLEQNEEESKEDKEESKEGKD